MRLGFLSGGTSMTSSCSRGFAAVALTVFTLGAAGPAAAEGYVLVKNAKNDTPKVTKADVKSLATGRIKTWKNAGMVVMVLGPENSEGFKWLAEQVVGVSPKILITKIRQEVFKGEMIKPQTAASDDETFDRVRNTPGAVGTIKAESAKALPAGVVLLPMES
jgi:ABC-type phosphate transport system substrate-binding protein